MPGICTSAMTQDVSFNWGEDKNSCAEANAYTENPIDLSNRAVAVRTEGSSSMTEMTGASATQPDLFSRAKAGPSSSPPLTSVAISGRRTILRVREGEICQLTLHT